MPSTVVAFFQCSLLKKFHYDLNFKVFVITLDFVIWGSFGHTWYFPWECMIWTLEFSSLVIYIYGFYHWWFKLVVRVFTNYNINSSFEFLPYEDFIYNLNLSMEFLPFAVFLSDLNTLVEFLPFIHGHLLFMAQTHL